MLYHITRGLADASFTSIVASIHQALWPTGQFQEHRERLPVWSIPPDADHRLHLIQQHLDEVIQAVNLEGRLYQCYGHPQAETVEQTTMAGFPFLDRYHRYFLKRQWDFPYRDPRDESSNLFRLAKPDPSEETEQGSRLLRNYSRYWGDFNHFINVITATARLIEHFSDPSNTERALFRPETQPPKDLTPLAAELTYGDNPSLRTFRLMIAALYHDLGKTVETHRHGIEGANILESHASQATRAIQKVFAHYGEANAFERDDLLRITHLIFYHDQFGVLSTGEAGYMRMMGLVHKIRRSRADADIQRQRAASRQDLFDLWVLNLADILVSLEGRKFEPQKDLWERESARARILHFLGERSMEGRSAFDFAMYQGRARRLRHDLRIALNLMDQQNASQHGDDLATLEQAAMTYARRHGVERIRRLLMAMIADIQQRQGTQSDGNDSAQRILRAMQDFPEAKWNSAIARCIDAICDFGEFMQRFCWIGQMDYAFGFLNKIAPRAFHLFIEALGGRSGDAGGWLDPHLGTHAPGEVLDASAAAECFADNLTSTLVQILHHLLFREQKIDRLRNLEFWMAGQRLTTEKVDQILALKGPFHTRSAMQLALESIFIW